MLVFVFIHHACPITLITISHAQIGVPASEGGLLAGADCVRASGKGLLSGDDQAHEAETQDAMKKKFSHVIPPGVAADFCHHNACK
jgi:hypothetical protein